MGLTVIVGTAGSGRTALASWITRRAVVAGKRVLHVSDEEQWLEGVGCERRSSGAFFSDPGIGLAHSATRGVDTLVIDSDFYGNIEDLRRLADEGKDVYYFMQVRKQHLPVTTLQVGDSTLVHIADNMYTINREGREIRLTQVKSRVGVRNLPLSYLLSETTFEITAEEC